MGKSIRIHLLDPAGNPGAYLTWCGLTLRQENTTRQPGNATCANCRIVYAAYKERHKQESKRIVYTYDKDATWGIHKERDYLDHLGTNRWSIHCRASRKQLLQSYVNTISLRSEPWAREAQAYAAKLYAEEFG